MPLKREEIRKQIQAVSAFTHFRQNFEDRIVAAGNKVVAGDQYFFDQILKSRHAREEFEFKPDDLELSDEAELALFTWAFSKPRNGGGDDDDAINENVFQKAEDIRLWQKVARYDENEGMGVTNFANRLSIQDPGRRYPCGA